MLHCVSCSFWRRWLRLSQTSRFFLPVKVDLLLSISPRPPQETFCSSTFFGCYVKCFTVKTNVFDSPPDSCFHKKAARAFTAEPAARGSVFSTDAVVVRLPAEGCDQSRLVSGICPRSYGHALLTEEKEKTSENTRREHSARTERGLKAARFWNQFSKQR